MGASSHRLDAPDGRLSKLKESERAEPMTFLRFLFFSIDTMEARSLLWGWKVPGSNSESGNIRKLHIAAHLQDSYSQHTGRSCLQSMLCTFMAAKISRSDNLPSLPITKEAVHQKGLPYRRKC
ncbi:hypothetical protein AVEN_185633-1 [Araneus ventricosus]|uniref:Uncharacterized protein n=1 Tax=Araneus ventricosus TaxID=182803 RepID=A0A4Y2VUN8_ARAVE|nr:hypothetical protein AVEN_185633-1 [Araneus ventricosus]